MIKRFVVWFMKDKCKGIFRLNGYTVRIFSNKYYDKIMDFYSEGVKTDE